MKNIIIAIVLCIFASTASAGIIDDIQVAILNFVRSFTEGESKEIKMPAIPKVVKDAKDISGYGKEDLGLEHPFYKNLQEQQIKELSVGFVNEIFNVVLGREPTYDEFQGKVSVLLQGGSREGVYRSLVLSDKYLGFEQTRTDASDPVVDFTIDFLARQLDSGIERKKLENFNFYTIKRFLVEKCLETYDAFPNEHSKHSWFALTSEVLQKNEFMKWQQKHRLLNTSDQYYAWAEKIPADVVKSEIVIKLHKIFNELQLR